MKKFKKLVKTHQQQQQQQHKNKKSKQISKRCSSAFNETRKQWYKNLDVTDDVSESSDSDNDVDIESVKYYFKKDSSLQKSPCKKFVSRSQDFLDDKVEKHIVAKNSSSYDNLTSNITPLISDNITSMVVKKTFEGTKENTISVFTGQIVTIIDNNHYFWSYVKTSDNEIGFVPKKYLASIPCDRNENEIEECGSENNGTSKSPVILPEKNEYMKATNLARVPPFNQNYLCDGVQNLEIGEPSDFKKDADSLSVEFSEELPEKKCIETTLNKKTVRFSSKVLEFAEIKDTSDDFEVDSGTYDQDFESTCSDDELEKPFNIDNDDHGYIYKCQTDENKFLEDDYKEYLVRKYLKKKEVTRRNSFVYNENKYVGDNKDDRSYFSDGESTDFYKKRSKYYGDKKHNYYDGDNMNDSTDCGSWC